MAEEKSKVLVVDDISVNALLLEKVLRDLYDVTTVSTGEKALEIVKGKEKPDLILLDILMPDMSGYDVIEELKKDEETKNIPVIFVSAKDEAQDEEKGFELGAADYLTKPIKPSIVKARVATNIKLYKQQKELEKQNDELQKLVRVLENKLSRSKPAATKQKKTVDTTPVEFDYKEYFLKDHIYELEELIEEIDSAINMILLHKRHENEDLKKTGELLSRYASILNGYPIFAGLGAGMYDFANVFLEKDLNPTQENLDYAYGCLESFIYTLAHWHKEIFRNNLKDLNAFDNSMLADMETIQRALENDLADNDDNMEFF